MRLCSYDALQRNFKKQISEPVEVYLNKPTLVWGALEDTHRPGSAREVNEQTYEHRGSVRGHDSRVRARQSTKRALSAALLEERLPVRIPILVLNSQLVSMSPWIQCKYAKQQPILPFTHSAALVLIGRLKSTRSLCLYEIKIDPVVRVTSTLPQISPGISILVVLNCAFPMRAVCFQASNGAEFCQVPRQISSLEP